MENTLQNAKRLSLLKLSQTLPEYKRFLFQDVFNAAGKITGIYGSRGVGKTTLLIQVLKNLPLDSDKKLIYRVIILFSKEYPCLISLMNLVRGAGS